MTSFPEIQHQVMRVHDFNLRFPSPRQTRRLLLALPILGGTASCSYSAAPSYALFGAFFPAWLLCGIVGVFAAILARAAFVTARLTDVVPAQLLVCTAIGVSTGSLLWLLWLGR